jgi:hypothetical protein
MNYSEPAAATCCLTVSCSTPRPKPPRRILPRRSQRNGLANRHSRERRYSRYRGGQRTRHARIGSREWVWYGCHCGGAGLDTNDGKTPATAWQTIAHVNAQVFAPGTQILFKGGETFSGSIVLTLTNVPLGALIAIDSFGTGDATISSGNSAAVTATNVGVTVNGLICTGAGAAVNPTQGILIQNTTSAQLANAAVTNCTVSGYGLDGIAILGTGNNGFNSITCTGNTVSNCTGVAGTSQTAGINITAVNSTVRTAHQNVTVTRNTVFDNAGVAGNVNQNLWSGSGIWLEAITSGVVAFNLVHDNGALSTTSNAPCGIIGVFVDGLTFQFNEIFNQKSAFTGFNDSAGLDIDLACINCMVQYNYLHDNPVGLLAFANGDPWDNNTFRFNVSSNNLNGQFCIGPRTAMTNLFVYNNTFSSNVAGSPGLVQDTSGTSANVQATFANNIFYSLLGFNVDVTTVAGLVFTGNNYFGGSFSWNGTTFTTFSAWQTGTGQEKIAGANVGRNVEPQLVTYGFDGTTNGYNPTSLTQYQLQTGSPMLGGGIDITAQYGISIGLTDFFGVPISSSSKVIGAGQMVAWAGAASATTPQAVAFLGRATSLTSAQQQQYNALISGLITDGVYSHLDLLYKTAGAGSAANANLNLIDTSFGLTFGGTVTFGAKGYTGDGATGWVDTGFTPSTAGGLYSQNSAHASIYITVAGTRDGISGPLALGALDSANAIDIQVASSFVGGSFAAEINVPSFGGSIANASTQITGLWMVERTASAVSAAYLNGNLLQNSNGTASTANVASNINILAASFNGVSGNFGFSPDTFGYATVGDGGLTANQIFLLSARINADAIALGINAF